MIKLIIKFMIEMGKLLEHPCKSAPSLPTYWIFRFKSHLLEAGGLLFCGVWGDCPSAKSGGVWSPPKPPSPKSFHMPSYLEPSPL